MPTTKKKPATRSATAPPTANGLAGEVLTLAEAAAYLRLSEAEVVDLHHSQGLPGRFTGSEWRFLKSAIQQWLTTGTPTVQSRKAAQLALAGKYKDDPDLQQMCEGGYRQPGRTQAEAE